MQIRSATLPPVTRKLFSSKETSEIVGICPRLLWTLANQGKIRSIKIGRLVKFSEEDINAFIDAHRS
jgi:excisionase family DNA binding protein